MIKIVIIEDLEVVLEGLKLLIGRIEDFEIVGVYKNGQEFLEDMDKLSMDIVLTDIEMPVLDGVATVKKAIARNPGLRFIALSMHDDRKYYYEMITAGAKGFSLKRASLKELEQAIREVHKGGNFFSPEILRTVIINMQQLEDQIIDTRETFLKLNERETRMIELICQGLTNKELADKLFVSVRTVETAKSKLFEKAEVRNNAGLIIWAIKNKVVNI